MAEGEHWQHVRDNGQDSYDEAETFSANIRFSQTLNDVPSPI